VRTRAISYGVVGKRLIDQATGQRMIDTREPVERIIANLVQPQAVSEAEAVAEAVVRIPKRLKRIAQQRGRNAAKLAGVIVAEGAHRPAAHPGQAAERIVGKVHADQVVRADADQPIQPIVKVSGGDKPRRDALRTAHAAAIAVGIIAVLDARRHLRQGGIRGIAHGIVEEATGRIVGKGELAVAVLHQRQVAQEIIVVENGVLDRACRVCEELGLELVRRIVAERDRLILGIADVGKVAIGVVGVGVSGQLAVPLVRGTDFTDPRLVANATHLSGVVTRVRPFCS